MKLIVSTQLYFYLLCIIIELAHSRVIKRDVSEPGKYLGCFVDQADRALPGLTTDTKYIKFSGGLTPKRCVDHCRSEGFQYAGVEYSSECFCGTEQNLATAVPADGCTAACNGDTSSVCGGTWRIGIYRVLDYNGPVGCFRDQSDRVLPGLTTSSKFVTFPEGMTPERCISYCQGQGFQYAGVEYAHECFCGNEEHLVDAVPLDACNTACDGNAAFNCGGTWEISVYRIPNTDGLLGCFKDQSNRVLPELFTSSGQMTPAVCAAHCTEAGFQYAGVEYAQQCFCGTDQHLATAVPADGCTVACSGNSDALCGGTWRINIYRDLEYNGPIGCYVDQSDRLLPGLNTGTKFIKFDEGMTPERCIDYCRGQGFTYAGVEYSSECFCGTEQHLVSAVPSLDGCTAACSGNSALTCGGTWRINVYRV